LSTKWLDIKDMTAYTKLIKCTKSTECDEGEKTN